MYNVFTDLAGEFSDSQLGGFDFLCLVGRFDALRHVLLQKTRSILYLLEENTGVQHNLCE